MSSWTSLDDISDERMVELLASIDYVIFSIDGVLLAGSAPIPGADRCVSKLRELGKKVAFVTVNPAYLADDAVPDDLRQFEATHKEFTIPNAAVLSYLKRNDFKKDIYVVGGKLLKNMLRAAGYRVIDYNDIHYYPLEESVAAIQHLTGITIDACKDVGAVILCNDVNFCLPAAQAAITILHHDQDVILLSGTSNDTSPLTERFRIIGPKFYIEGIERWTSRKCVEMEHTGVVLEDLLRAKYDIVDPNRVLFVADSVPVDVTFGDRCGFKTLLVLSGTTSKENILNTNLLESHRPDYVVDNLNDFFQKIKHIQTG